MNINYIEKMRKKCGLFLMDNLGFKTYLLLYSSAHYADINKSIFSV